MLGFSSNYTKILVEIILGFFGMMANGLLILANRLSSPTINSVVRRSEIILVLIYDVIWFKEYPDVIEGCGYVVVLISVIIMTFADQIQESILKLKNQHLKGSKFIPARPQSPTNDVLVTPSLPQGTKKSKS